MTYWMERLLGLLYPPRCVLCGQSAAPGELWCGRCPCDPAPPETGSRGEMLAAQSALCYRGGVRLAVLRLKRRPHRPTARFFAGQMAAVAKRCWPDRKWTCVVPVPLSPEKEEKGFNHAGLLAEELGRLLKLPVEEEALERREGSAYQHRLGRRDRLENAGRVFAATGKRMGGAVLLVDDVRTTGATLAACRDCLLRAGAAEVLAVTAAWSPKESRSRL